MESMGKVWEKYGKVWKSMEKDGKGWESMEKYGMGSTWDVQLSSTISILNAEAIEKMRITSQDQPRI